jgi:glycosyltransferase involved in cell wall biosynthesis
LASVIENTRGLAEVIVVDDGSNDGSCDSLAMEKVRVIRHAERIGVARSRDEGSRIARGDVLCYLDAHQRIGRGSLDHCARVAIERGAITCPDVKDYGLVGWRLHGARFRLCPKRGYFSGTWRRWFSLPGVRQVTGLRVPPYLLPRNLYHKVAWSGSLRGWGASEASMVVKSFFLGIPIYHIAGPLVRHRFQRTFSYPTSWEGVWRNQAIIARVCFDDATWVCYWLPKIFDQNLSNEARATLCSSEVQAEHADFLAKKVRTDRQFWTELLRQPPPHGI